MSDNSPVITIDSSDADEAYQRVLPEAMALDVNGLATINVDVPTCIITGMGVLEKLPAYRDRIQALPDTPTEQVAKFPDYLLALFRAQARYTFAATPPEPLHELFAQATARREILTAEAKSLIARGALNPDALDELTGTHGYKNVAFDLSGLAQVFKAAWPNIQGKTGLQMREVEETASLALKLAAALAHRQSSAASVAAATDVRQRIFTLFTNAYNQLRRATWYLRWDQGDVDSIIPSLYAGRTSASASKRSHAETKPTPEIPLDVPAASTGPGSASTPIVNKVPVGFPGSEPYHD